MAEKQEALLVVSQELERRVAARQAEEEKIHCEKDDILGHNRNQSTMG